MARTLGPYFDRITLTGGVHARITYDQKYKVWIGVYHPKLGPSP
jgi:hypothetical protein